MSSQSYEEIRIEKSPEVAEVLESRHILDDEVKMVIDNAEKTGEKLYRPEGERFLAKLRIGDLTVYVEYSPLGERAFQIHTAYAHKSEIKG